MAQMAWMALGCPGPRCHPYTCLPHMHHLQRTARCASWPFCGAPGVSDDESGDRASAPEDLLESREPYVVQLGGHNPRVGKVQMVLMTLPELKGPMPRLVALESRMRKVIRGVCEGAHRRIRAGPRQHADVHTLEGVGSGRPPPPCPLHLRQVGVYA